tara:strand:- start:114 stop:335 length:222 start_codon:yes stop_codon:yes gene_type:complete
MTEKKRYRVQVQFDVYADSDKHAAASTENLIKGLKSAHNSKVIYFSEAPYANINQREIDFQRLAMEIKDTLTF